MAGRTGGAPLRGWSGPWRGLARRLHLASRVDLTGRIDPGRSIRRRPGGDPCTWEAFAEATRALNRLEERNVIEAALHGAAQLFRPDRAEVEVADPGGRPRRYFVRPPEGDDGYDVSHLKIREPDRAGPEAEEPVTVLRRRLLVGAVEVGELRLGYARRVRLSGRQQHAFSAYADAVSSALHDASTHRQLRAMTARSAYETVHDSLTGLHNRSMLLAKGDAVLRRLAPDTPVALALLDVDGFREVNDALGHAAGDELLRILGQRLAESTVDGELVGRLGGDEFALLIVPPSLFEPPPNLPPRPAHRPEVPTAAPAPEPFPGNALPDGAEPGPFPGNGPEDVVEPGPFPGNGPEVVEDGAGVAAALDGGGPEDRASSATAEDLLDAPTLARSVTLAALYLRKPAGAEAAPAEPGPTELSSAKPPKPEAKAEVTTETEPVSVDPIARARAVTADLARPVPIAGVTLAVEVSAGVGVMPAGAGDLAELLRRADVALSRAKRSGTGVVGYDAATDEASVDRPALLAELRDALATTDEIVLELQPMVDLESGRPWGAEALVRWRHPRRGLLYPADFLAVVEQSDLVDGFTWYVLDQALGIAARWLAADLNAPIAVNISARSLTDPSLPDVVAERLRAWGVPADRLILDITEQVMAAEPRVVHDVIAGLRRIGVLVAVDDFGTGYSSLTFMTRVPVDLIKVDRTFVSRMGDSAEAAAIVRATVDLARDLGLRVVAEGVEMGEHRTALGELGVTSGQGFLFHPAMGVDEVTDLLRSGIMA